MVATASVRNESVYSGTARFDKKERRLSEAELMDKAPSIFAAEAHESRSERFAPIATIDVLRGIAKHGFVPVGVKQSTSRDEGRAPFTKHLIRLRRLDGKQRQVGDTVFEMLLKNANDGTAAYHLMAGLWRIRCMNSLVVKTKSLGEISIRHTGDAPQEVLEASFKVLEQADRTLAYAEAWGRVDLKEIERINFAKKAHKLRWEGKDYGVATAVTPGKLLEARRSGDEGSDLWSVFNVVQENIIRGGVEGDGKDSVGRKCHYTSRPVNGIDADVTLNTALWGLADELATKRGVLV
jgi:hypothetical protein